MTKAKMTKKTTDQAQHDRNRREFLKKSTLISAGVVATTTIPAVALAEVADQAPDKEQQKGYHRTTPIREMLKAIKSEMPPLNNV